MTVRKNLTTWLMLGMLGLLGQPAFGQFSELARQVPDSANMMVLVNAQKALNSPMAKREGWASSRESRFQAGTTFVPPGVDKLVIAAQLDLEFLHPMWEVAIAELDQVPDLEKVAQRFQGAVDNVAGKAAVKLPDDSFLVQISQKVLAAMAPGNRQQVARWLQRRNGPLSGYIQEGIGYQDAGTEVIMLLDIEEALTVSEIAARLENAECLEGKPVDKQKIAEALAQVRGIMLGITFGDTAFGSVKVDFAGDVSVLQDIAKPLLLEILQNHGMMIDELTSWEGKMSQNEFRLSGPLTDSGLTRISTLITLPSNALEPAAAGDNTGRSEVSPEEYKQRTIVEATKSYYNSIDHLIRDLEDKSPVTMGQKAQWYENYARKIDRLPILNVDPEMLQYGSYVSSQLRGGSMGIKGVTINQRVAETQAADNAAPFGGVVGDVAAANAFNGYPVGYRYGRYGNYGYGGGINQFQAQSAVQSQLRQQQVARTQVKVQARAAYGQIYQQTMAEIQEATAKVRKDMTLKYQVEF